MQQKYTEIHVNSSIEYLNEEFTILHNQLRICGNKNDNVINIRG